MDKTEAKQVLKARINELRAIPYHDLLGLLDTDTTIEVDGPSGTQYQIETSVFWDSARDHRNLRVVVAIDDGGWRSFMPVTDSFIMAPDGSFVGE